MGNVKRIIVLVLAIAGLAAFAQAEDKRRHDAHEHGVGKLNLAFDENEVALEFSAPGADIVGFEHPAESTEDKAKIKTAIGVLENPLSLFQLPDAAKCTVLASAVELHEEGEEHKEKHAHEDHHDKDAKHEDKDEDHKGHKDRGEPAHTEFHAEYRLACKKLDAIDRIVFEYFATFSNARQLDVQMISKKGTNGFQVKRDDAVLDLNGLI